MRDRVVQTALRMALEPIFEQEFAEHSYGFRPGRGCKDALRRVDELLKAGYTYIVDADLKSYFDTIPHDRLMALVGQKVSRRTGADPDRDVPQARRPGRHAGVDARDGQSPGGGDQPAAQQYLSQSPGPSDGQEGFEMVRYADDFVILCRSPEEATRALAAVQAWTAAAGLTLHPTKTRIVDATEAGFEFLGYRFEKGRRYPRAKSLQKLKDAIRAKTKRTSGQCLRAIIDRLNPTLRGWFEYFKHSYQTTFRDLDGWIRMRLRSILRKRQGRKGRGRGTGPSRWPNAFFAEHGLYSLKAAHALACQSSSR